MDSESLPLKLLSSLEGIKGFHKESFEKVHTSGEQITSIRLNPAKALKGDREIGLDFSPMEKIPWASHGYYLSQRPSFTLDPLFQAGLYYVQEASSMFLEQVLKQTVDLTGSIRILDLCAAPGGKSTLIQSIISDESLLVSNEVIKTRVNVLQENIIKWGASNVIITNNDPKDFSKFENYFDVIVIDAPCSGSGLFRRDREAIGEWSEATVKLCSMRQQRILADAWPSLKKNGVLVYSTCSYSKEENEDNIDWIMGSFNVESLRLNLHDQWSITEVISDKHAGFGYRFYPDKIKGEGFFIACFHKVDGDDFLFPKIKKSSLEKLNRAEEEALGEYVNAKAKQYFFKYNEMAYAIPDHFLNDMEYIRNSLYLRKAGILMGKFAGNELIPEHELALSTIIKEEINALELSKEEAIMFLRKEEVKTDSSMRGWTLARYKNQNLGWMKILPNRINNYYPKEWRVRMIV
ncbi:MAG: RNA methyltransferase [Bacteroidetes bacterium]|nr:RNA methyltransferase [Bacteroidota bacterium]